MLDSVYANIAPGIARMTGLYGRRYHAGTAFMHDPGNMVGYGISCINRRKKGAKRNKK